MKKLTGRCLCRVISYEINGELGVIYNCHCSKCRRWGGDAFRTSSIIKKKDFIWTSGEGKLAKYQYNENVTKTFCSLCGANLISLYRDKPEIIGLSLGGLEQDPGVKPTAHIFVGSKAPWHEIADSLPQYQERVDSPKTKISDHWDFRRGSN